MNNKKVIAYLAPEVPALSATFVYQEILQLEKMGLKINSVSIHRPINKALSPELEKLEKRTFYLYEQSFLKVVFTNLLLLVSSPIKYTSTLLTVFSDINNVGVFSHVGKGLIFRFIIAAGFVRYLKENNIEHIHANFAHIPTDIAMYAAALHGISFSFNSHANDLFERGWLLKEKVSRSKFATTISEFNKQFLIEKGAEEEKIKVIHCGVYTDSFSNSGTKELSNPPLLGSLGRIVEKKGFDVLIRACEILKRKNISFKLQIAGGGPLKPEFESLVNTLNLTGSIDFIDSIPHKDVPDWIKNLDVFVLSCKKDKNDDMDGIPVVLMESMLSSVPVITTRISGIPELVENEETGLLCDPNDAESLAEKIQTLLSNYELRRTLCKNAISKVQSEFELDKNVQLLAKKLVG